MRDPKRINRIMTKLKKKWEETPDQRFYQFLINQGLIADDNKLWNKEDDETEEYIDNFLK